MAYTTLQELSTAICNSIRQMDGTTALINHQDIPSRILNLGTRPEGAAVSVPITVYASSEVQYITEGE